jgi:hypothetical protein
MAHITQMYKWIITHTNTWVIIENIDTQNISLLENPLCISLHHIGLHLPDFIIHILFYFYSVHVFASELRTTCSKFNEVLTFQQHKWPKQIELVPHHHYPFPSYCHPWDVDNIFNMLPPSLFHPKLDVTSKEP